MKAFIFVALVASVTARGLNLDTLALARGERTLVNRPVLDDVLVKDRLVNRLPVQENSLVGVGENVIDTDFDVEGRVLSFSELYNTVLFRQYLQIPLFRQYIQYPAFQRYVASIYFQRFYQLPAFQTYFRNPVLFYKYIYPIVQVFQQTQYPTQYQTYGQQDILGLQGVVDDLVVKNRNVLPYVYNYNRYNTIGQDYLPYATSTNNYRYLLEKIQRNLYADQIVGGNVAQIQTDVKVLPEQKVVIEPITGEQKVVADPKIVDVQVSQKVVPQEVVPVVDTTTTTVPVVDRQVDTVLLKQLVRLNLISQEVYDSIVLGQVDLVTVLLRQRIITPEQYQLVLSGRVTISTVLRTILEQYPVVDRQVQVDTVLLKQLVRLNLISQEVYDSIVLGQVDLVTVLLRQRIITPEQYQLVLVGRVNINTLLRTILGTQIPTEIIPTITTSDVDVIDTNQISQVETVLLRQLVRLNLISQEVYESILIGKVDIPTVLLQERLISSETYQLLILGRVEVVTVLRQIIGQQQQQQVIPDVTYPTVNNYFNTNTFRRGGNLFNRLPLQNVLRNIVA